MLITRVVIDVGCATHGGDESINYLISEFDPDLLLGFDPATQDSTRMVGETLVIERKAAVTTYDGYTGFMVEGLSGRLFEGAPETPCFDLAGLVREWKDREVILKMDAETAEFELLPYLMNEGLDSHLLLAWVERHCLSCGRGGGGHRPGCKDTSSLARYDEIAAAMGCEMHSWNR
jgi:hypothetical protein